MQINETSDYAIRVVLFLASREKTMTSEVVSKKMNRPIR